ncbi:hypothetical protein [Arenimonas daejeonensis]|uniref:hypothetical protein n=1 Tax=Arenimonas daejeonensis TaxID=370777 RepID=UPI0011BE2336|nr:hypothetical protein [Arenimonas daejeonensis]
MRALLLLMLTACLSGPTAARPSEQAVAADAPPATAWAALAGTWRGSGEVRGMAAEVTLEFRESLGGRGRHLRFENLMRGEDSQAWPFRAEALYLCDPAGACRGHWYDSRGMVLPLAATATPDRVVVDWGDADTERGRTTYALTGNQLRITDEVLGKDGVWKVFGRTVARRTSD